MKTYGSSWNVLNGFCNIIFTVEKFEILYNFTLSISLQSFENLYKIQPLFLGKFLRLGVPREIVSRATLGTRAIGHACHRFATAVLDGVGNRQR